MGETNRVALRYKAEATYGTVASGNYQNLRYTSESLAANAGYTQSQEIRSDRRIAANVRTQFGATGSINYELSYGTYDDFLLSTFQAASWSSPVTVTGITLSVTAGSGTFAIGDSANGFGSINVGQWVKISGFASAANNGIGKVTAAAAGSITVTGLGNGVTESAGESVTVVQGGQIVEGTTFQSFTIEKQFSDNTNDFAVFTGMGIGSMSLSASTGQIITGAFEFLGQDEANGSSTIAGTPVAASTTDPMQTVDDVTTLLEGDSTGLDATAFTINFNNNMRQKEKIGRLGPFELGSGSFNASGNISVYYESGTLYGKFLADTVTSLSLVLQKDGAAYVFDFPAIKLSSGNRVAGGINQDVIAQHDWTAQIDDTEGIMARIVRFPAS